MRSIILAFVLSGCFAATSPEPQTFVGYAAVGTDSPARGERYTWTVEVFELRTHIPGCSIIIGADDLTEATECVVPGRLPFPVREPEVWSFGPGRAYFAPDGSVSWHGATLHRTGLPPARVSFQPFP